MEMEAETGNDRQDLEVVVKLLSHCHAAQSDRSR